jgi:hypothetical protein
MAVHEQNPEMGGIGQNSASFCSGAGRALEPFVDADAVAGFLEIKRRQILDWARVELIPAHPLGHGRRRLWRFRLSEVEAAVLSWKKPARNTIVSGSPHSRKGKL